MKTLWALLVVLPTQLVFAAEIEPGLQGWKCNAAVDYLPVIKTPNVPAQQDDTPVTLATKYADELERNDIKYRGLSRKVRGIEDELKPVRVEGIVNDIPSEIDSGRTPYPPVRRGTNMACDCKAIALHYDGRIYIDESYWNRVPTEKKSQIILDLAFGGLRREKDPKVTDVLKSESFAQCDALRNKYLFSQQR